MKILLKDEFTSGFRRLTVRRQMIATYIAAGLVPLVLLGLYLAFTAGNLVLKHHEAQVEAENTRVRNIVFQVTYTLANLGEQLAQDENLKQLLSQQYSSYTDFVAAFTKYDKLHAIIANNTEIGSMLVYSNNPEIGSYGIIRQATPDIESTEWYQAAAGSIGQTLWFTVPVSDKSATRHAELAMVRKINLSANEYAVIYITASNNYLKLLINDSALINEISVGQQPVFYTSNIRHVLQPLGMEIDYSVPLYHQKGFIEYGGADTLLKISSIRAVQPLSNKDNFYVVTLDPQAKGEIQNIMVLCLSILALSSFFPLFLVIVFSSTFSKRVHLLRREMKKASQGEYQINAELSGNDELNDLLETLKTMVDSIQAHDKAHFDEKLKYEQALRHQQQMRFELLSAQINPHFLFNTLEAIRMKARSVSDYDAANAIKLLGQCMRYMLEVGGQPVSLESELEYLRKYFEIHRFRFGDRVCFFIEAGPEIDLKKTRILPMLLQPVAENAIKYGLSDKKSGGFLRIDIRRCEDTLQIAMQDNGAGMEESRLKALREQMNSTAPGGSSGIGLKNVNQRIKLHYGESYGLQISSSPGQGTCVMLSLPQKEDTSHGTV